MAAWMLASRKDVIASRVSDMARQIDRSYDFLENVNNILEKMVLEAHEKERAEEAKI